MVQIIDNVNKTNSSQQKRLRQYFGYRNTKSVIDSIGGIDLGTRQKTRENRAYAVLAQQYNAEILEARRAKKIETERKRSQERRRIIIEQKKERIKNNTIILQSGDLDTILDRFYNALGDVFQKGRTINVVKEGGQDADKGMREKNYGQYMVDDEQDFRLNMTYTFLGGGDGIKDFFKDIFLGYLQIDSDTDRLQNDNEPYTLYINIGEQLGGEAIIQSFKDGVSNCLFKPIIEWSQEKLDNAKTKGTIDRYRRMRNNLLKDELLFRDSGVSKEQMSFISNKYQINIEVNTPFQKEFIKVKSNKKALTTFRFINTRINHLDHNEVVNLAPTILTQQQMNNLKCQLNEDKTYHTYTRNQSGYSSISTLDTTYKIDNEYNDIINDFEIDTGIINCYLDDFVDVEVSKFVRQGVHFNECVDFKTIDEEVDYDPTDNTYDELMAMSNEDKLPYKHIDMEKAYAGFTECKYYEGFVGKITDFRPTNKIVDIGYYRIQKLNFDNANPVLKEYNEKMKIYNDNIYPSPELKFLKDNNVEFEIIEGCWGSNLHFEFTEQMKTEKINKIPIYSKYTGCMYYYGEYKNFYMYCDDKQFAQHIVNESDYDMATYIDRTDELQVSYKKQHNNHLSHICGFITSYMRLNVLEQLMTMKIDNIIRVCVDGIYYDGNQVDYLNVFRNKTELIKTNKASDTYISNYECNLPFCENTERENIMKELHAGVGGSGKTHLNIYDKGLIRKLFVAPSWKLSKAKNVECGIPNQVWANICTDDPEKINYIRKNFNVLIIDEISMMSNEMKNDIFKYYPDMKIIMCGDNGFQLPQFNEKLTDFKEEGFDKIIRYTINRRCKCDKLQDILDLCREQIDNKFLYSMIKKAIKQRITKDELKNKYSRKDMILCRTNSKKDEYTEMFKHIEKYYIIKTDKKYCNGEIVYEKPDPEYYKEGVDYQLRHAYTIHSIQGETAKHNLYVDNKYIEPRAIYTALSRAEYLSQIYIID
tara:strand:- start:1049 stop:4006 length:2958 start_codon:yes stop_codon:yes gene_type:complete